MIKTARKNLKTKVGAAIDTTSATTNAIVNHTVQYLGKPAQHNTSVRHQNFASSKAAKQIHHTRTGFRITMTMRNEIQLVSDALSSNWIDMWRPIRHLTKRTCSGIGYCDSCLHAGGGYSINMGL